MKKIFVLLLVLAALVVALIGCNISPETSSKIDAMVDVSVDKAIKEVSRQIGDLDVKRQEIVNAIAASQEELQRLDTARVRNVVEAELAQEAVAGFEEEKQALARQMAKLAEYLTNDEELVLKDGSTMDAEEMNQLAEQLIWEFDLLEEKLSLKQQTLQSYQSNIAFAEGRLAEGRTIVTRMEGQLDLIDAQIEALKVYEDKPELLVEGGSFTEVIPAAQELISETQLILREEQLLREQNSDQTNRMNQAQAALDSDQPMPTDNIGALLKRAGDTEGVTDPGDSVDEDTQN